MFRSLPLDEIDESCIINYRRGTSCTSCREQSSWKDESASNANATVPGDTWQLSAKTISNSFSFEERNHWCVSLASAIPVKLLSQQRLQGSSTLGPSCTTCVLNLHFKRGIRPQVEQHKSSHTNLQSSMLVGGEKFLAYRQRNVIKVQVSRYICINVREHWYELLQSIQCNALLSLPREAV